MPAQFRYDTSVNTSQGVAVTGAQIYVCTQPANTGTIPPSPLATLFADPNGVTPLANPVITDGLGNAFFYTATGTYTLVIVDPLNRINELILPDQEVVSPGGGSVTSVGMTGDGVVFQATIPGSPITSADTLRPALKNTVGAEHFLAGPVSGPAGPWVERAIQSSDLPADTGTVLSVGLTVNSGSLLTQSVSGSPVISSGTITATLGIANQNPNSFLRGPASGSAGPTTSGPLVAADIFGLVPISFSTTPNFNAGAFASPLFTMTLSGNVASSSVTNPTLGQIITFEITQNATGGWTFSWPSNFKGASNIGPNANDVSLQSFVWDGTWWRATGPGSVVNT